MSSISRWLSRLPWWLIPWPAYRASRRLLVAVSADAQRLARANSALDSRIAQLTQRRRGEHELGWEQPGLAVPQWLLLGVDRKDGRGVRVYASGSLASAVFGMTGENDPPPRFQVRAVLGETLVIDKPTYPEGIAHWLEILRSRQPPPAELSSP